ncbi:MAG: ribosome silencing factor [Ignavibacteria bacterium]|nr:ribosome silencing factor [Ignavibacteria bacterium]
MCFLKKASDVALLDIRKVSDVTDFFILCSGDSDIQVRAIANAIMETAKKDGLYPWHNEGMDVADWVIIDFVDVVVHIFQKSTRTYYNLEKLWGDAKIEYIEEKIAKPKLPATKAKKKSVEK